MAVIVAAPVGLRPRILPTGRRLGGLLLRHLRGEPQPRDAASVKRQHLEPVPVDRDGVAHSWQATQGRHDVTRGGFVGPVGQLDSCLLGEVLDVEQTVDIHRPSECTGRELIGSVVLVPDVADEFLHEIFERDDSGCSAVFVDDDGDVSARSPHLRQRREQALGPAAG